MKLNKIAPRLATAKTARLPLAHHTQAAKPNPVEKPVNGPWRPLEVVDRLRGRALQATRWRLWKDDPHCAICGRLVAYPAGFELDHKLAVSHQGSSNDDDNLQILCVDKTDGPDKGCHAVKTRQEFGRERGSWFASNRTGAGKKLKG